MPVTTALAIALPMSPDIAALAIWRAAACLSASENELPEYDFGVVFSSPPRLVGPMNG